MILYVLVLYKCTLEESKSFQTLLADSPDEQRHIFVYDNSPYRQETATPIAHYVHDIQNGGLGKAYNTACRYAQEHHYQWLMFLDQDTEFPAHAIEKYRQAIADHPQQQLIAPRHRIQTGEFMSPTHYRMKASDLQKTTPTGIVAFNQAAPINSGMLVTVSSFLQAGGYDEAVWLDFSDIRFIEKYKRHYTHFYVMDDLICMQHFSATDTNPESVMKRYCIYLECASNYPKETILDSIAMLITTLRPTLSRTVRERTFKYLRAYWHIYLKRERI